MCLKTFVRDSSNWTAKTQSTNKQASLRWNEWINGKLITALAERWTTHFSAHICPSATIFCSIVLTVKKMTKIKENARAWIDQTFLITKDYIPATV